MTRGGRPTQGNDDANCLNVSKKLTSDELSRYIVTTEYRMHFEFLLPADKNFPPKSKIGGTTGSASVAGSRPTKVVCITVLTGNRMGMNCTLSPAATPSSEL